MMILGFASVGFMAFRRKRGPAFRLAWSPFTSWCYSETASGPSFCSERCELARSDSRWTPATEVASTSLVGPRRHWRLRTSRPTSICDLSHISENCNIRTSPPSQRSVMRRCALLVALVALVFIAVATSVQADSRFVSLRFS